MTRSLSLTVCALLATQLSATPVQATARAAEAVDPTAARRGSALRPFRRPQRQGSRLDGWKRGKIARTLKWATVWAWGPAWLGRQILLSPEPGVVGGTVGVLLFMSPLLAPTGYYVHHTNQQAFEARNAPTLQISGQTWNRASEIGAYAYRKVSAGQLPLMVNNDGTLYRLASELSTADAAN